MEAADLEKLLYSATKNRPTNRRPAVETRRRCRFYAAPLEDGDGGERVEREQVGNVIEEILAVYATR